MNYKLFFTDITVNLTDAFDRHLGDLPFVRIHRGSILNLDVEAVVSPANSFGFMDGGIDGVYTKHFGGVVQDTLQAIIKHTPTQELLVGQSVMVPTQNEKIPYVISAPTMRVPQILPKDTINPYLATKAVLQHVRKGLVKRVAFCGMGTGVGGVSAPTGLRIISSSN